MNILFYDLKYRLKPAASAGERNLKPPQDFFPGLRLPPTVRLFCIIAGGITIHFVEV
ncbi:MAG: hypothetical protein NC341_01125 [Blautia sp.]|nr:hypothetical protein [Blautia sp.]